MQKNLPHSLESSLSQLIISQPGDYAIAVKNLADGHRWLINSCPMRSASLIKIFIMVEAFNQFGLGTLDLTEKQSIDATLKVGGAGSLQYAPADTTSTWRELIDLMIIESDNIATNLLIDRLTMANINQMIEKLGCTDTILSRKMMDFTSAALGRENLTTVEDVTRVLESIYWRRCLDADRDTAMLDILFRQEDKCKLPVLLPPGIPIAHKTGELEGAEHDAGIIYGSDTHYIIVIMTDFLPDAHQGQETIAKISRLVYDFLHIVQ